MTQPNVKRSPPAFLPSGDREAMLADAVLATKSREELIAVVSHDLRNPLYAIKAGALLLQKQKLTLEARRIVENMLDSYARAISIIEELTDFSGGSLGGGLKVSRTERAIKPLLQQIVQEHLTANPDRVVLTDTRLTKPPAVDRTRFGQLFSNLLGNAITYGAADQPIHVEAYTHGGCFELKVRNGGQPIPPDKIRQIFEPFRRGDDRARPGSLGLGLYIVAEVAHADGGTVEVTSDQTCTCFRFSMPLEPSAPPFEA